MGKGYESDKYYKNIKLSFHSIANLDGVVSSYGMLTEKRYQTEKGQKGFYKALGNSEWYGYISDLLEFSIDIAKALNIGNKNVLLHCSDGWDRTA